MVTSHPFCNIARSFDDTVKTEIDREMREQTQTQIVQTRDDTRKTKPQST
jgi:hypothetical protein